jgi:hypothetical protein
MLKGKFVTPLEYSYDKEEEKAIWAGTVEEMARIGSLVEELADKRAATILAEFDAHTSEAVNERAKRISTDSGEVSEYVLRIAEVQRQSTRDSLQDSLRVVASLKQEDSTVKSDVNSVMKQLDPRRPFTLKFELSSYDPHEQIEVKLTNQRYSYGVRYHVVSEDPGWGKQVYVQLGDEIVKGVPSWSWLRKGAGGVVISVVTALSICIGMLFLLTGLKLNSVWLAPILGVTFAGVVIACGMSDQPHSWLFPRLEITHPGNPSIGARRLSWLGTLILTIAVGVFVNLIS